MPAFDGKAIGGGFELTLSRDLIYASNHSCFVLPGLADAVTIDLPKRVPYHVAKSLCSPAAGWMIAEVQRWSLVEKVLPQGKAQGTGSGSSRGCSPLVLACRAAIRLDFPSKLSRHSFALQIKKPSDDTRADSDQTRS
ncbi:enoyl-CoA hydratase-related protein [Bradyrhizobium sp. UFLA06-06]